MTARPGLTLLVLAPSLGAFILSQFHRSAHAVLAPIWSIQYGLSAEELGLISSSFHFVFAVMQIPVGLFLDRYGVRRTVSCFGIFAVIGAVVFANAENALTMMIGQGLIGGGCSPALMGTLVLAGRWYAPERFSSVSGMVISISMVGVLLSATPLAFVANHWDWQTAYWGLAAVSAVLTGLSWLLVQDAPQGHAAHQKAPEALSAVLKGLRGVLATPAMWPIMGIAMTVYPAMLTVRGLWAGPYLHDVVQIDAVSAGNVLLVMTIIMTLAPMIYGQLAHRINPGALVCVGVILTTCVLFMLSALSQPDQAEISLVLAVYAAVSCFSALMYTLARSNFADQYAGRALTTVNLATFVGLFVLQAASGGIVGLYPAGTEEGYRLMFLCFASAVGVSGVAFIWARRKSA